MNNLVQLHPDRYFEAITSCDHCTAVMRVIFRLKDAWLRCPNCGLETNTPDNRPGCQFLEEEEDYY